MSSIAANDTASDPTDIPKALAGQIRSPAPLSTPVEMSRLGAQAEADDTLPVSSSFTPVTSPEIFSSITENQGHDANPPASGSTLESRIPAANLLKNSPTSLTSTLQTPLNGEKTAPAIGPSSDKPTIVPKDSDTASPELMITLLLINGARHPYKIDDKYLKKRSVIVENSNPINMSTYTLKELIWREWREEWEARPSSPSSIRLIYYGKLLDDKMRLQDCKFVLGTTPHVVHMTVKPQEIVDEEDAKMAKSGNRDRDGNERRSPGCRCVIL